MPRTKVSNRLSPLQIFAIIIVIVCLGVLGAKHLGLMDSGPNRPDSECLKWGVTFTTPGGSTGLATTPDEPQDRRDAERMARRLQGQDTRGYTYKAVCLKWKDE